jgi:spore germination cell wall hydrolase CwlJ-like protein
MMKFINKKVASILAITILSINLSIPSIKVAAQEYYAQQVATDFNDSLECLADNIYWEAGSESFEGKLAVAQVTMNRVNSGKFRSTVCDVVKQKDKVNGYTVCQFSWFCEKFAKVIRSKKNYDESVEAARIALTEPYAHGTIYKQKAMYYHATSVNPNWQLPLVTKIGNHIFYKERSRI